MYVLCAEASDPGNGKSRFSVDHNHETGEVRGLLCNNCNRAFGLLGDNVEIVRSLLFYALKYGEVVNGINSS